MSQIVARFDYRIDFAVVEDIGKTRRAQEDAHLVEPALALFAVADGMGGHAAGEVASRLALEEVGLAIRAGRSQAIADAYIRDPSLETRRHVLARLRRVVERANERVRREAESHPEQRGMGTTLDVVWLARDHAFVAHSGDSRVYLARPSAVLQLTQDHAELDELRATGVLRPYGRASTANRLLNAVGLHEGVRVDTLFVDLHRGDRLLLCTDGVHGQIGGEAELGELLRTGSARDAARALVQRAAEGGRDNATALVVAIADRFVRRQETDQGMRAMDVERAQLSPLLVDLPLQRVMTALSAAVEVELEPGAAVPQVVASDFVAYIVLDGLVRYADGRLVSVGALLFAESLVAVSVAGPLPVVDQRVRLLRLRRDDFMEVCDSDPPLAVELLRRLATHLARSRQRTRRAPEGGTPQGDEPAESDPR